MEGVGGHGYSIFCDPMELENDDKIRSVFFFLGTLDNYQCSGENHQCRRMIFRIGGGVFFFFSQVDVEEIPGGLVFFPMRVARARGGSLEKLENMGR